MSAKGPPPVGWRRPSRWPTTKSSRSAILMIDRASAPTSAAPAEGIADRRSALRQGLGARRRTSDPSALSVRGEEAGRVEISMGVLQFGREGPGRGGVPAARQERLSVGEEVKRQAAKSMRFMGAPWALDEREAQVLAANSQSRTLIRRFARPSPAGARKDSSPLPLAGEGRGEGLRPHTTSAAESR
jgi:hypothetical protein